MKRIAIHCSLECFLEFYEESIFGMVSTIISSYEIMVEGRIVLVFGTGGYYPECVKELIQE